MIFLLFSLALALDPSKVKYAVNCGGDEVTTYDDVTYLSDRGYSGGISSDYGKSFGIKLTKTPEIYQTERYATEDLAYTVPLKEPGNYVLILKFSDVFSDGEQKKMFHIKIGSIIVTELLDIYSLVGKFSAYDEFIEFKYESDKVFIKDVEAVGAVQEEELKIELKKTNFDNPKINGIILLKGSIKDTSYYDQKKFLEGRKRRIQEDIERSNQPAQSIDPQIFEEDENDFEPFSGNSDPIQIERTGSLFTLLTSLPALGLSALLILLGVGACFTSADSSQEQTQVNPNLKPKSKSTTKSKNSKVKKTS